MDSSLRSTNVRTDEQQMVLATAQEAEHEEEQHVHLPNPSLWPLLLSVALVVTVAGLFFLPDNPWLTIIGAPFVLITMMGWALEDPNAHLEDRYEALPTDPALANSPYQIGQEVVDKDGMHVGTLQARFGRYVLVERGSLFVTAYYVPTSLIEETAKNNTVRLTVREAELKAGGYESVPDDLYGESADSEVLKVTGVPLFAGGPLSPAETGHYNYGPNFPGMNTDASGSYHRDEVSPSPQQYVSDWRRRKHYQTDNKPLPPRSISSD